MNIPKLGYGGKISRQAYNRMADAVEDASKSQFVGGDSSEFGNPVNVFPPDPELGCWARIKGVIAGDGGSCCWEYTWIEVTRYITAGGDLAWRDTTDLERFS